MNTHTEVGMPINVTDASFAHDVLQSPVPVLVDFWAAWCPPCRAIASIMNQLAAEYAGRISVAKINTDDDQRMMLQYGVRGLPTLIVFRDGQEVARLIGARSRRQYQDVIEALLQS